MKCPNCNSTKDKVIDSRYNKNTNQTRRRRECLDCSHKITTYESSNNTFNAPPESIEEHFNHALMNYDYDNAKIDPIDALRMRLFKKETLEVIGNKYGVSKQAVHDLFVRLTSFEVKDTKGMKLKITREKLKLTTFQMSDLLNTPEQTYIKWEEGQTNIPGIVRVAMRAIESDFKFIERG